MSERFYFPERLFRIRDDGNLMAFFTFVDNTTGLEYSNWRLMSGVNGIFISSPAQAKDPKDGTPVKYYNYVKAAYDSKTENKRNAKGDQYLQSLAEAAHTVYQRLQNGAGSSGRGPVGDDGDDDDLPF